MARKARVLLWSSASFSFRRTSRSAVTVTISSRNALLTAAELAVDEAAGLPARRFAFSLVTRVLDQRVTLEEAGEALASVANRMEARDAAFGRAIAYAALRHNGSLEALLKRFVERPLPEHGLAASRVLSTSHSATVSTSGMAENALICAPPMPPVPTCATLMRSLGGVCARVISAP